MSLRTSPQTGVAISLIFRFVSVTGGFPRQRARWLGMTWDILLSNHVEALRTQCLLDLFHMVVISGFQIHPEEAILDVLGIAAFVVNVGDVAAAVGDDTGNISQTAGHIGQLDHQSGDGLRDIGKAIFG